MARPSNKAERRKQITRGLMKVMASSGYDGASVSEIAAAANLTPGLIHYHFKSKREILLSVLQELVVEHDQGLEARLAACGRNPIEQLKAFIDFHLGFGGYANVEALSCWIVLSGEALRQPEIRIAFDAAVSKYVGQLIAIIDDGNRRRQLRCSDPKAAACALVATIQGYFVLSATARSQIPRGSASRCTREMAQGLLKPIKSLTS